MLFKNKNYQKIVFEKGLFDALICLNTINPDIELIKSLSNIPILAADGAGIYLLRNKIEPNFVIGDLDSFSKDEISKSFPQEKLIFLPDQETNDFEKTLNFARYQNYQNLIVFGIHGGEYEHSLNNWSVLSKYSDIMNIVIYDNNRYGFCISRNFILETKNNELISLIPKGFAKITTQGLKWNLNDEILALGVREGARNIAITNEITINITDGEIFVFLDSRFPNILRKEKYERTN